ncbi:hypothetical protein A4F89_06750 [Polynucleobacter asymbioticus]|jgi:phage repressor protein C with HTH and peptisase S24 domain|uniref:XRE family transcriptional regulator n=1 Tax=Polynucleobacter asymbioticus TaxID=576611 RepID=UPI0008FB8DB8|nr:S24 family peptidase [Polynucleobacter asymbioticus]APB99048.1 hypothetical protein A4F89_06750 [Polynucleobacter asymbioticus]
MNKVIDFGDRLQLAMTLANVSRKDLAAKLGISVQAIGMVISGQSKALTAENNAMAADCLGCKSLWLATGKGEMAASKGQEIDLENNPDFPAVKKVNLRVSAGITGFGVEPCTGDDSLIVFRADWYQSRRLKPDNLLALKVSGASMEPNLYDGDVVVMNRADTELKDGEVFVFNLDGEVVIKRAVRDGGQWWLDSDNQDKTRFTRKACPDGICIPLGKVIHRQTERI